MKNLKRILSLALASVMVMGMMVVGASAAFEDQDQIQHTEAVTVLNALKVMQGNPDGTFDPKGELTRAQAATLLSILINKGTAPNYGVPTNATFSDVRGTADAWAEQYIEYCASFGYVSGVGGGKFAPSATLTATTWARMILNVLGITLESADNWALRTEVQARDKSVNLYNGIDEEITDPTNAAITRDQAAQMLFNGIMYAPESTGSSYVVKNAGGEIVYQGTDPITALLMKQADDGNTLTLEKDMAGSILKETFGVTPAESTDAFGRTTTEYKQGSKTIATIGADANKVYTARVTMSKIYNDLGLRATKTAEYIVNGVEDEDGLTIAKADTSDENAIGGNGSTVEVFYDGTNITVVQVDTFAAEVTKVTEAKAATATTDAVKASVTLTVMGSELSEDQAKAVSYNTTGYEEDDIVLVTGTYTTSEDGSITGMTIQSMSKASFVVGTVSATATGYLRVDGEKYVLSYTNDVTIGTTAGYKYAADAAQYTYYLDATGSIIYAAVGAAAEDNSKYIYVLDVAAKAAEGNGNDLFETTTGKAAVAQAQVMDLETGAVSIKNMAVVKHTDGKYYYANQSGEASNLVVSTIPAGVVDASNENHKTKVDDKDIDDTFYKYVELDNGDIVLTAPVTNSTIKVQQGKAELGDGINGYANNTTKVTIYEKDTKGNISSKGYTGIANFPETETTFTTEGDATAIAVMYKVDTSKLVTEIIVVRKAGTETSTANYAIYAGVGETSADGTAYNFYVNGELKSYFAKEGVDVELEEGNVATLTFEGEKLSAAAKATALVEEATIDVVQAEYFVATKDSTAVYYLADDCVTVDAGDDYKTAEIAKGDKITVYGTKDKVEFIIIVE